MQSLESALYDLTGYDSFKGNQRDVISSILNGRNVMSIAPTGSGKSLEFQLPAYVRRENELSTLVVSPLIALMEDQVVKSYPRLRYAAVNSLNPKLDNQQNLQRAALNEIDLLYISPESLTVAGIVDALKGKFDMVVIDEAHCVSTWGHSFRPAYILLGDVLKELEIPQYSMFTATAPERLRKQITSVLGINNYDLFEISHIRDNIKYTLNRDDGNYELRKHNISDDLKTKLNEDNEGLHIVYTNTINDAKELLYHLKEQGIQVSLFHGQMSADDKLSSMKDFKSGKSRVMVCTNAFGMGIDIPNIRTVINYKLPSSIEDYVQQTGRAGRDGTDSDAILYYNSDDLSQLYRFIQLGNPLPRSIESFYSELKKKVDIIKGYQESPVSYLQLLSVLDNFGNENIEHKSN
jgi:ATP-dependent DNA helicase RecQ